MNSTSLILAVGNCTGSCLDGTNAFWGSGAGKVLGGLMGVVGIIVVIVAVLKCFGKVTSGKIGEAVKIAVGAAIFAAFLFNPQLIASLIGLFGSLVDTVIGSFGEVVDGSRGARQ